MFPADYFFLQTARTDPRKKKTLPFRERPFPCCELFQGLPQHPSVLAEACDVVVHQGRDEIILFFFCRFLDHNDFFKKIFKVCQYPYMLLPMSLPRFRPHGCLSLQGTLSVSIPV